MLWALLGCTVTGFEDTPCTANAECRDAFGFGWACDDEVGLCEEAEVHPRCASSWPEDLFLRPENYRDTIVFASMFDHSADRAEINATRLPIIQVTEQGGLHDRDYAIVECTYEENPALDALDYPGAAREVSLYVADTLGIPAIIGPATSSQTQEVYNATRDLGVFIISPSATSPALTLIDGAVKTDAQPGLLWRTAPPDSLQGVAVAKDMRKRGLRDVAVIFQTGPYGEGLANVFIESFRDDFHTVLEKQFTTDSDRDTAVAQVGEDDAVEEVFFISSEVSDIIAFLNGAAVNTNYDEKTFFLADGAADEQMLQQTSQNSETWDRIRGSRPAVPEGNVYQAFDTAYAAAYGVSADISAYTGYSFDATWLAIYGSAWSGRSPADPITGVGIAQGLRRVSNGIEVEIRANSWNDVKARFAEAQPVDVVGASGELDYDPDTEETTTPIEIWSVNDEGDGFDLCTTWCWDGTTPTLCGDGFDACLQDD